jgi:hypothetical protein
MVAALRRWVRDRPGLAVAAYASIFAVTAFALTRPVLLVNDGQMYFEMARSMRHGSLELDNGLDLVDSPELWMQNSVKLGRHLYVKYPPLYGVLAAVPYSLFGIRGLYLLNAVGFVVSMLGFHDLARRMLAPSRAGLATVLLPFAVPLVPYMLMEMPHLVALAPLLWAIAQWDDARRSESRQLAARLGVGAGLLVGLSFGVRVQNIVFALPLGAVGFSHARHRRAVLGGMFAGLAVCVSAVAAFNLCRFGSPNPFSYGPAASALGAPIAEESVGFFLRPALVVLMALVVAGLLAARWADDPMRTLPLWVFGVGAVVAVPALRDLAFRMVATFASTAIDAGIAGAGWHSPGSTLGWIDKALLSSTPFAVLGLIGAVASAGRRAPPLQTALAWTTISLLLFLSVRNPDPRTERGVVGFMSLSPRYLVEIMPALYLLAWDRLRGVRFGPGHFLAGLAAGGALFAYMQTSGPDDVVPAKAALIVTGSIVAAAFLALAYCAGRNRVRDAALRLIVALSTGYAAACIFAEDCRCFRDMAAMYERWGDRVLTAMPEPRVAIVGWHYAKDAIFHVRARKSAVIVDPSVDGGASLAETLDALVAHGVAPYYFGIGLERIGTHLEGRYRTVPVLSDPLLWRLEALSGAAGPSTRLSPDASR